MMLRRDRDRGILVSFLGSVFEQVEGPNPEVKTVILRSGNSGIRSNCLTRIIH
jgi:hypothetical protein